jgi:hypothetical protein
VTDTPEQRAVADALQMLAYRAGCSPGDGSPLAAYRVYCQLVADGVTLATEQDATCPADCAVAQWLRRETGLTLEGWPRLFVGQSRVVLAYRKFDDGRHRGPARGSVVGRFVELPTAVRGAMEIVREKRKVA